MTSELVSTRFDADKISLIARTIAKGCTPDELQLFVAIADRTGLDPFARQIFAVKRYDGRERCYVMQTQVSIDGARLTAQRSGEYAGQTATSWCGADGVWLDVWLSESAPAAARVGVYRRGFAEPLVAIALWREYCPYNKDGQPTGQWPRMPALMIAKCAESLALRKAFPAELSGIYTAEEMEQSSRHEPQPVPAPVQVLAVSTRLPVEVAREEQAVALPVPIAALAALPAVKRMSKAERAADTLRVLAPAAEVAVVDTDAQARKDWPMEEFTLLPSSSPAIVLNGKGRKVWRIDQDDIDTPLAVLDDKIASNIEANQAFGLKSTIITERVGAKRVVVAIREELPI